ncbi:helix-turn-helix domain-containing protein [Enterococcus faecium]|uniref:helix-turn-helix domain-containing protein n=1 Tax=Enterococcus faecium TaxID=1352 RepID=UPI001BDCBF88|nr:helix-turn-helix domain-containing protein [Enterococcus faecium]MBT1038112.1 helix-turn-helix domain-containing protein [Enterococcus faecium]
MVDKSKKRQYLLVPLSIILSALEGDPISIKMILKHYHSYMAKLCLTNGFNEVGRECKIFCVNRKKEVPSVE